MKKLLLLITFFNTITISSALAQTFVISKYSPGFPKSMDSTANYNPVFWVINLDTTLTKPENIFIFFRVKNNKEDSSSIQLETVPVTVDTFKQGDSVEITTDSSFSFENYDPRFFVGNDIVVIWPTGSGGIAITGDSIIDTVHIDTTTGISPLNNSFNTNFVLYPNPTENLLYINYDESKINLGQVRIYNLLGQTMLTKTSPFNSIDISTIPDGFYFLDAITTDKSGYKTQFIKSQ